MPSQPLIGTIMLFGGNFAPVGWAFCDGQLLSIDEYTALYFLLGTTYGGDGLNTFALPDLRGRVPIHQEQGPGLTAHTIGELAGTETVTLTTQQMPAHTHALGSGTAATSLTPTLNPPATTASMIYGTPPNVTMAPNSIGTTGGSQSHTNMQPYQAVSFVIALEGIYPSRG